MYRTHTYTYIHTRAAETFPNLGWSDPVALSPNLYPYISRLHLYHFYLPLIRCHFFGNNNKRKLYAVPFRVTCQLDSRDASDIEKICLSEHEPTWRTNAIAVWKKMQKDRQATMIKTRKEVVCLKKVGPVGVYRCVDGAWRIQAT